MKSRKDNIITEWNFAADNYMKQQEQSSFVSINKQIIMKRFPKLNNENVLDLGCGYGVYTNYFRTVNANAIGIDGSKEMLRLAKEQYPDCHFELADFNQPLPFSDNSFDIILCNQVLMDIENIDLIFSECQRILKKNGIFFYAIVHPAFYDAEWLEDENHFKYSKVISNYIEPYQFKNTFWGETTHFHRPLSEYLNTASKNGFMLIHTEEPVSYDGKTKTKDLPLFFIAEYRKI